jgi:hypothetical protein
MFFLLLPKATKHGTFQGPPSWEPSIGHQVGVFLSLLTFLFFLKREFGSFVFFFGRDFQFEFLKTCSYNFLWEEKND